MRLQSRLNRLERIVQGHSKNLSVWDLYFAQVPLPAHFDAEKDLDPRHLGAWYSLVALPCWLSDQGFRLATEAVEAGASPPPPLEKVLKEQAAIHYYQEAYGYLLANLHFPDELWIEFAALRTQVHTGSQIRWADLMPQFQRLALWLREITQGRQPRY